MGNPVAVGGGGSRPAVPKFDPRESISIHKQEDVTLTVHFTELAV